MFSECEGGPLSGKLQAPVCNTDEILSSDSDDDDGDAHSGKYISHIFSAIISLPPTRARLTK